MSRTLQPEDQIARYRVVGPLGAGGMGEVYAARDETLERSVALKVLPPRLVKNEERVRRFVTEAKSASSLNHPNIVTIYEIGHDRVRASQAGDEPDTGSEPVHFISMELISGDTLTRKIHDERTDLKTLVGYVAQAAEGIAKAHAAGIIHRDLKPGNIMISQDGFAKVLDFGLAKLTERQGGGDEEMTSAPTEGVRTGEGVVMGTVGYMSPEQVQAKGVDHRSDIFSLGCILYEAATRRRPFIADTDVEVMHQILRDKPRPVEELNPEAPAELRRLIRRCLAKGPDQRLQSMKDLAIELREVVEEWETLSASATSATSGVSLGSGALGVPPARTRLFWAVAGTAALLGIGGLAVGVYGLMRGGEAASSAAADTQEMDISVLMSRDDLGGTAVSRDGRYLAYTAFAGGKSSLNVHQVRTGSDAEILPPQEVTIRGISFSPDGDYLYFLNRDTETPNYSALYRVASLGGTPEKMAFDVDTAATFSPDGKQACFRRGLIAETPPADSLVIVDLETREERTLIKIEAPESFRTPPAWSPDGATIAVVIGSSEGGVKRWIVTLDAKTGEKTPVGGKDWSGVSSLAWAAGGHALFLAGRASGSLAQQIYRVSWPGGEITRLTNDLNGYGDLSIAGEEGSIFAVRTIRVNNIWSAPVDGSSEPAPLTTATGSAGSVWWARPLHGGAVAFIRPEGSRVVLERMESDGSGRRRLVPPSLAYRGLAYTEKSGLVFTRIEDDRSRVPHIWSVNPDGTGLEQVTRGDGESLLELSPRGDSILFRKQGDSLRLWAMDLPGGEPRLLHERASEGFAPFSPDGQRVLVTTLKELDGKMFPHRLVIPARGGEPLASFLLPPRASEIHWTPDGKAISFVDEGADWNIYRYDIGTGKTTRVTSFDQGDVRRYRWSHDGSRMYLWRRIENRDSLWILTPADGKTDRIVEFRTGQFNGFQPTLDERGLVFEYGTISRDVVKIAGLE